jgi:hypothetical protein
VKGEDDGIFIASKIDSAASSPRLGEGSMKHYTHMSCSPYHDLHFMKSRGDEGKSLHYENISSFLPSTSSPPHPLVSLSSTNFLRCASARSSKTRAKRLRTVFLPLLFWRGRLHDDVCKLNKRRRANESFRAPSSRSCSSSRLHAILPRIVF